MSQCTSYKIHRVLWTTYMNLCGIYYVTIGSSLCFSFCAFPTLPGTKTVVYWSESSLGQPYPTASTSAWRSLVSTERFNPRSSPMIRWSATKGNDFVSFLGEHGKNSNMIGLSGKMELFASVHPICQAYITWMSVDCFTFFVLECGYSQNYRPTAMNHFLGWWFIEKSVFQNNMRLVRLSMDYH